MKAMIFAAGLGTRLKPLTDTMPKALVPVCGKPLLEHVLMKLQLSGVSHAVVNVHHFADSIQRWIDSRENEQVRVDVSDERALLLETGGAVLHARRFLENCGRFLIHNVDILSNADLAWFEAQVKEESLATLLVSERPSSRCFLFHPQTMRLVGWKNISTGDVILGKSAPAEKDCLQFAFSGIHILSDKVFTMMDAYVAERHLEDEGSGVRFSIKDFYMWAMDRMPIYGVVANGLNLLDVGKLDSLDQAEKMLKTL